LHHLIQYNNDFKTLCDYLRTKKSWVILGGKLDHWFLQNIMKVHSAFDFGFWGESEFYLKQLVDSKFKEVEHIPNLYYRENDAIRFTFVNEQPWALDLLPLPALNLFEINNYGDCLMPKPNIPYDISRGCWNNCSFCSANYFSQGYRHKSPIKVVEDLRGLQELYGIRSVTLSDENLLLMKNLLLEICRMLLERRIKLEFFFMTSINALLDFDNLELLYQAGFRYILIGLETSQSQRLAQYNKSFNSVEKVKLTNRRLRELGFYIQYTMITGNNETTGGELFQDFKLLWQLSPAYATFAFYTPYREFLRGQLKPQDTFEDDISLWDQEHLIVKNQKLSRSRIVLNLRVMKFFLFIYLIISNFGRKHRRNTFNMVAREYFSFFRSGLTKINQGFSKR
jgi:radical SAM superfamily enzyme YgiQ (UPF0313 family)